MNRTHLGQLRLLASPAAPPPRLLDQLAAYEDYLIGEQRRRRAVRGISGR